MKFDVKYLIIVALVILILFLLTRRMMSSADPVSAPAPSSNCSPTMVPVSQRCPADYPKTGTLDGKGNKQCCAI